MKDDAELYRGPIPPPKPTSPGSRYAKRDKVVLSEARMITGDNFIEVGEANAVLASPEPAVPGGPEELNRLRSAEIEKWVKLFGKILLHKQMKLIRETRVKHKRSWRMVAALTHKKYGDVLAARRVTWHPPSSQMVGMALCKVAAAHFKENYLKEPWN